MRHARVLGIGLVALACEPNGAGHGGADERRTGQAAAEAGPEAPTGPTPTTPTREPGPAAGELAYLAAAAEQGQVLDQARAEAEGCDAGQADACRRLANRYEEGLGAPRDRDRALGLYARGCVEGSGFHCLLGGWLQTATRDVDELGEGLGLLRRACELDHLAGCTAAAWLIERERPGAGEAAELRARACRAGYVHACAPGSGPSAPVAPVSAEAACPTSFYMTSSQAGGPRLHAELVQLDHAAMLATLPERVGVWTSERRSSTPAGWAGTRTSSASATLVAGDRRVGVSVIDRAPDCTLQSGTGAVMLAAAQADRADARSTTLGDWPAVLVAGPGEQEAVVVTAWIADRCVLSVDGRLADVVEVAAAIDHAGLTELCARRPTPGDLALP